MASLIDLFKGSPYDSVKQDTETFIEQETSGLRVKSAAELNNPLLYGNESIRIATKSTPMTADMKEATQGELASGGLVGLGLSKLTGGKVESINQARNSINDLLGIPQPLIPTRVAKKVESGQSVQDVIDGKNGTEFGKFLQQTGGGSFENIAKNALGNAIEKAKSKATKILIGSPGTIGEASASPNGPSFVGDDPATYTETQTEIGYRGEISPEKLNKDTATKFEIDLSKHSPVYGVSRGDNSTPPSYTPDTPYTGNSGEDTPIKNKSLSIKRGMDTKFDKMNSTAIADSDQVTMEKLDLVPFWISLVGETQRTHFRTTITGLSETISPSWNSGKFFGNPFSFHTYGGVERSVTFNLFIYCMDAIELGFNWEKINKLTQYTYPTIHQLTGLSQPPIIEFKIGDIYNQKIGIIESLSYTMPDNGVWETEIDGYNLPKFIEVSISIKFIEQIGDEVVLYNYKRSSDATQAINDYDDANAFNLDGVTVTGKAPNNKINSNGVKLSEPKKPTAPILLNTGKKSITPAESTNTIPTKTGETSIYDERQTVEELERVFNRKPIPDTKF